MLKNLKQKKTQLQAINLKPKLQRSLPRHPGDILLNLFDLVNDLRGAGFKAFCFAEIILRRPELPFVHHDGAKLQVGHGIVLIIG